MKYFLLLLFSIMYNDISYNKSIITNRCKICNKKVPISTIKCKCGELFCSVHRYTDTHNCSIDYKTLGKIQISNENPKIKSNKL